MECIKNIEWKTGAPPVVGWWLCDRGLWWRYWNGECFSHGVKECANIKTVALAASKPALWSYYPLWCDYWPDNAICNRGQTPSAPKKRAGNKRKTAYLLNISRINHGISPRVVAVFSSAKVANSQLEKELALMKNQDGATAWLTHIRFRTPEA